MRRVDVLMAADLAADISGVAHMSINRESPFGRAPRATALADRLGQSATLRLRGPRDGGWPHMPPPDPVPPGRV